MSDLLFMGGAFTVLFLCVGALVGMAIYEVVEFTQEEGAPFWAKSGLVIFMFAFVIMILGVALKIMENL